MVQVIDLDFSKAHHQERFAGFTSGSRRQQLLYFRPVGIRVFLAIKYFNLTSRVELPVFTSYNHPYFDLISGQEGLEYFRIVLLDEKIAHVKKK